MIGAGARKIRVIGFNATLEFDYNTGILQVFYHQRPAVEQISFDSKMGHYGGDRRLMENFLEMASGGSDSCAPLEDGILSALVCLRARQSSKEGRFREIAFEDQ